jgi:hypothetical protein
MENISNYIGQPLYWLQPKVMERYFEFRSPDSALLGTLRLDRGLGMNGAAESADGKLIFERLGLFKSGITIRKSPTGIPIAKYSPKVFSKGILEFTDGRVYKFGPRDFWWRECAFTNSLGSPVVKFRNNRKIQSFADIFKARGKVDVAPEAGNLAELPLLVTFGWFLLMLIRQRRKR